MSTILKALRRLEEQKSAASPRPLRDEVVLVPARRRRRSGAFVALVAAFGFAVLGGALVWLLDREPGNAVEPITAIAAAKPLPRPFTLIVSAAAPPLMVKEPVGLVKVVVSPAVQVTLVWPAEPESATVIICAVFP